MLSCFKTIISQISRLNVVHNCQLKFIALNKIHNLFDSLLRHSAENVEATRSGFCCDPEVKSHLTYMCLQYGIQKYLCIILKCTTIRDKFGLTAKT